MYSMTTDSFLYLKKREQDINHFALIYLQSVRTLCLDIGTGYALMFTLEQ